MYTNSMKDAHVASDQLILDLIKKLQDIQKTHYWKSPAWQTASEMLAPLFNEMERRTS